MDKKEFVEPIIEFVEIEEDVLVASMELMSYYESDDFESD